MTSQVTALVETTGGFVAAVKAAVDDGRMPQERLYSYLKLQDELSHLARQQDERAQLEQKRRGRIGAKALRQHLKSKRG